LPKARKFTPYDPPMPAVQTRRPRPLIPYRKPTEGRVARTERTPAAPHRADMLHTATAYHGRTLGEKRMVAVSSWMAKA